MKANVFKFLTLSLILPLTALPLFSERKDQFSPFYPLLPKAWWCIPSQDTELVSQCVDNRKFLRCLNWSNFTSFDNHQFQFTGHLLISDKKHYSLFSCPYLLLSYCYFRSPHHRVNLTLRDTFQYLLLSSALQIWAIWSRPSIYSKQHTLSSQVLCISVFLSVLSGGVYFFCLPAWFGAIVIPLNIHCFSPLQRWLPTAEFLLRSFSVFYA